MNRICPFLLALLLVLSGCSKSAPEQIKDTFEMSTTIHYSGNEYAADIFASAADLFKIEFTAPEKIKGLCFNWDVDKGTIEYKKLEYKFTSADAPEIFDSIKSAFQLLFNAKDGFSKNSDGTYSLSSDNITIELDAQGTPTKINTNGIIIDINKNTP